MDTYDTYCKCRFVVSLVFASLKRNWLPLRANMNLKHEVQAACSLSHRRARYRCPYSLAVCLLVHPVESLIWKSSECQLQVWSAGAAMVLGSWRFSRMRSALHAAGAVRKSSSYKRGRVHNQGCVGRVKYSVK